MMQVFHSHPFAWVYLMMVAVVGFSNISCAWSPTVTYALPPSPSRSCMASYSTSSDNQHRRRPLSPSKTQSTTVTATTMTTGLYLSSQPSDSSSRDVSLDDIKTDLVRICSRPTKPSPNEVRSIVRDLEELAEQVGLCAFFFVFLVLSHVIVLSVGKAFHGYYQGSKKKNVSHLVEYLFCFGNGSPHLVCAAWSRAIIVLVWSLVGRVVSPTFLPQRKD
jgi:hypothetical protein